MIDHENKKKWLTKFMVCMKGLKKLYTKTNPINCQFKLKTE